MTQAIPIKDKMVSMNVSQPIKFYLYYRKCAPTQFNVTETFYLNIILRKHLQAWRVTTWI